MAKVRKEITEILARYDLDPKEALWDCHGTLVIYHKSCELIAAKANITFDAPQIIEAKSADKIAAICAVGRMGDRCEWSIGEAAPGNNKNAYPYAMAEKRAKDRVILKLAGLSAYIHSEDEADDFKDKPKGAVELENGGGKPAAKAEAPVKRAGESLSAPAADAYWAAFWQRPSYELKGANITDPLTFGKAFEAACKRAPTLDSLLKLEEDNLTDLAALNNQSPHASKQAKAAFGAAQLHLTNRAA